MERPLVTPEHLLSIPAIADALDVLADAEAHVARISAMDASEFLDAEDHSQARWEAEDGLRTARQELQEVIIAEALEGGLTYDEALTLLHLYEFECDEASSADFADLLGSLTDAADILIKHSISNAGRAVRGTLSGKPELVPYAGSAEQAVQPVVVVEVEAGGVVDAELLRIKRDRLTGQPQLAGVIVGTEAIEHYLSGKPS
jgi:hypothetical protein